MVIVCAITLKAQTVAQLIKQAEAEIAKRNETEALQLFKQVLIKDRTNILALQGASLMCCRSGDKLATMAERKNIFNAAKGFGLEAVRLAPNNADSYYVLAVAIGRAAMLGSAKEKIAASRSLKSYIDKCVSLNPNHAHGWHVIGRYNYEIGNLNFAERNAANLLFGGLPKGDLNTAIKSFEKCRSIDPTYILNMLDLAKAYKKAGNLPKTKELLNIIPTLPQRTYDDAKHKLEAKTLLGTLN